MAGNLMSLNWILFSRDHKRLSIKRAVKVGKHLLSLSVTTM